MQSKLMETPSSDFDPEKDEERSQYLIKWKGWSYIQHMGEWRVFTATESEGSKKTRELQEEEDEIKQWYITFPR